MANYQILIDAIKAVIKKNENQEITGDILQQTLVSMINQMAVGGLFLGEAKPNTIPINTDVNSFYVAKENGVYSNFGGYVLENNNFVIFGNNNGGWSNKIAIPITATTNNYNIDPGAIVPTEALYNNTDETLAIDLFKRVDYYTGEDVNYREVLKWDDGTAIDDSKVDGIIFVKKDDKFYKRKFDGEYNIKWFGAIGDGLTDDTAAFVLAKTIINRLGGGTIKVPEGVYILHNFDLDKPNIILKGVQLLTGYEGKDYAKSTLVPLNSTTKYVARLKGIDGVQAAYSGFENILFDSLDYNCNYGLFVDSGITIVNRCFFIRFKYGCVLAAAGNMNVFENSSFVLNTLAGFVWSEEDAATYVYPDIDNVCPVSSTKIIFQGNKVRQNGYGIIIRESANTQFFNCVFESNKRAGAYILRTDISSVYNNSFVNCWFENNYDWSYNSDWGNYSFDGINLFLISDGVYQPYDSTKNLGYQIIIDSQTRNNSGGSGSNYKFESCEFNPVYDSLQKSVKIISAYNIDFNMFGFTANTNSRFSIDNDTVFGVKIYKPYGGISNLVDSNFGGLFINALGRNRETAKFGSTAAPIYFPLIPSNDERVTDPNTLHSYIEGQYDAMVSTGSGMGYFNVSDKVATYTKIGRFIHIECRAKLTCIANLSNEYFYTEFPYPAITDNNIIGRIALVPTGTTPQSAISNGGTVDLKSFTTLSAISLKEVFNTVLVGHTFDIFFNFNYTSSE